MGKGARIAAGVVAAAVVGYPCIAGLMGLAVRNAIRDNEQRGLDLVTYLQVVRRDYREGVYGATEALDLRLTSGLLPARRPSTEQAPVTISIRSVIHHGPFPNLRSAGLATVDSEIRVLPAPESRNPAPASQPSMLRLHTRIGWFGGSTTDLSSAAYETRADATHGELAWRGMTGTMFNGRDLATLRGNFSSQGLALQNAAARISVEGVHGSYDMHRVFDALYAGTSNLTASKLEIRPAAAGTPLELQELNLSSSSERVGEFCNFDVRLAADTFTTSGGAVSRPEYDIGFSHIDGAALAGLNRDLRKGAGNSESSDDRLARILAAAQKYGTEILLGSPVIELRAIRFSSPEGEFKLTGRISVSGLARADLVSQGAVPAVIRHVAASFDLAVDAALANRLAGSGGKGEALQTQLRALEQQGYLISDHGKLSTHVVYENAQLKMNGKPFVPSAVMPRARG